MNTTLELITIKNVKYKVERRNDCANLKNTRALMDKQGIKGYIYLTRLNGVVIHEGVEYKNGQIKLA